jgi:hypothetical protein
MSIPPMSVFGKYTYDIEHSTEVIKDCKWTLLKMKVVAVAVTVLSIGIFYGFGITATRSKSRYTTYSIGTVSWFGILALVMNTTFNYKEIAKSLNKKISSIEGSSKILITMRATDENARPIDALCVFYRQKKETLTDYQGDLGKKTEFFKAKLDEAYISAIMELQDFNRDPTLWCEVSEKIKSHSDDEPFVTFSTSAITCGEMQAWSAEEISQRLITIMDRIQPRP